MSKEQREEKKRQEIEWFMNKYKLKDLEKDDLIVLNRITEDLIKERFLEDHFNPHFVTYLSIMVKQNWMIIKQLSNLNKNIEKLQDK